MEEAPDVVFEDEHAEPEEVEVKEEEEGGGGGGGGGGGEEVVVSVGSTGSEGAIHILRQRNPGCKLTRTRLG